MKHTDLERQEFIRRIYECIDRWECSYLVAPVLSHNMRINLATRLARELKAATAVHTIAIEARRN